MVRKPVRTETCQNLTSKAVRIELVRKLVRTESAVCAGWLATWLARKHRPNFRPIFLSVNRRARARELGAGAQRLDALKPGVTKTLVTGLVTKERAGFQSAVSNQVSMETDVLPTVSSGPVSKAASSWRWPSCWPVWCWAVGKRPRVFRTVRACAKGPIRFEIQMGRPAAHAPKGLGRFGLVRFEVQPRLRGQI